MVEKVYVTYNEVSRPGQSTADCLALRYGSVHKLCQSSALKILDEVKPNLMIAIGGGGYVPARILRSFLKQPGAPNIPIQAIGLSLYEQLSTDNQIEALGTKVTRTQWLDLSSLEMSNLIGKNVLIVDEVDDTRTTLEYAVRELEKDVETARKQHGRTEKTRFSIFVLHNKNKQKKGHLPEEMIKDNRYIAALTVPDVWICYPWEATDIDEHDGLAKQKNNNVNRSLVISSPALDALQGLVIKGTEMEILLPTLYNICTDFDEPALNENGQPYHLPGQLTETGLETEYLTMAEARLQIWPLMEIDDKFLEASGPLLADLMEMSSRSALFDISITLRHYNSAKGKDPNQRAVILSHKILHQGTKIACTSTEAQASICQTCLNLYSQPMMQKTLAQSSKDIELFMEVPYLTASDQNKDIDLSPYRESFLRQLYAVSALPEYQKLASPDSDLLASLTQYLAKYEVLGGLDDAVPVVERDQEATKQQDVASPDNASSLTSILALLNNALCDLERVEAFLNHHSSVCKHIMVILLHTNMQPVMLPSLNLVNRLVLCPTGAQKLYAVDRHFSVFSRLLKHKTALKPALGQEGANEAPIQRETITFARLLIKSSPSIALALVQNPIYYNHLLHLFLPSCTTPDTASRSELARLNIAILRTITGSRPASAADDTTTTTIALIATAITDPTNLPLLTASLISFLLAGSGGDSDGEVNGPTTSTTEALFGLAIFASIFISPSSPHHNPSVKPALLSRIIEEDQAQIPTPDIDNLQILLTHLLSTRTSTTTATIAATGTTVDYTTLLNDLNAIATRMGLQFASLEKKT
ncbi:hypothetical protein DV736_g3471, partial [Chaetothyriales sp. CBS 134916]